MDIKMSVTGYKDNYNRSTNITIPRNNFTSVKVKSFEKSGTGTVNAYVNGSQKALNSVTSVSGNTIKLGVTNNDKAYVNNFVIFELT